MCYYYTNRLEILSLFDHCNFTETERRQTDRQSIRQIGQNNALLIIFANKVNRTRPTSATEPKTKGTEPQYLKKKIFRKVRVLYALVNTLGHRQSKSIFEAKNKSSKTYDFLCCSLKGNEITLPFLERNFQIKRVRENYTRVIQLDRQT